MCIGQLARMDMRKLVGRNFARLRREKGFTQERFSEVSGMTQQYVSGLERGHRNPTIVTLFHLASALGVSPVELVMPDDDAGKRRDPIEVSQQSMTAQ